MLQVATYAELRSFGAEPRSIQLTEKAHRLEGKTVFLSHASAARDLVPGATLILENHGGSVYVDDRDPSVAGSNIVNIADHLRRVIKKTQKFVMLATPRSKDSKWIPWELGLGDGVHGPSEVALFPSAETALDFEWAEQEYLGLYRRILFGDHQSYDKKIWMVIDHRTREAVSLSRWLHD